MLQLHTSFSFSCCRSAQSPFVAHPSFTTCGQSLVVQPSANLASRPQTKSEAARSSLLTTLGLSLVLSYEYGAASGTWEEIRIDREILPVVKAGELCKMAQLVANTGFEFKTKGGQQKGAAHDAA